MKGRRNRLVAARPISLMTLHDGAMQENDEAAKSVSWSRAYVRRSYIVRDAGPARWRQRDVAEWWHRGHWRDRQWWRHSFSFLGSDGDPHAVGEAEGLERTDDDAAVKESEYDAVGPRFRCRADQRKFAAVGIKR